MGVSGQEDHVLDRKRTDKPQELRALGPVALPAIVRQAVELLDGDFIDHKLELGGGQQEGYLKESLLERP
jgi:hypothetical protein